MRVKACLIFAVLLTVSGNLKRLKVRTKNFKGTSLSTLLIVSLMALAILLLSVGPSSATPEGLTPRAPIGIDGNDGFIPANGVTSGSGTVGDPYIIENWAIDASTAHGILIKNTTAHFIIRNCLVENGGYGIYLENVVDGGIENSVFSNNGRGILLSSSPNNTIENNTVSNNSNGIALASSDNNLVSNNVAENNYSYYLGLYYGYGISLAYSSSNTIENNIVSNNGRGIQLSSSPNNTIENNTVSNNYNYGISLASSDNNLVSNNVAENNSVYGIYLYSSSDNNHIYHNNFVSNTTQAYDYCSNRWDDGYPSGGNYWSDYTGADNYRGENQDVPGSDGIGDTPYNIAGSGANQDRYPLMNPVGADTTPPVAPTLILPADGSTTNDNTPTFDWSDVSDAAKYEIWVDNNADFSSPEILENVTLSTYTPAAALLDGNYSWRVRAFDSANNAGDYSPVRTFIIDTQPPGIPTLLQPADGSTTSDHTPAFDWSDIADPSGVTYTLEIVGALTKTGLTASTYTLTSAEALADGTYSWHVRAVDGAGNVGEWSTTWSLTIETIVPPPPYKPKLSIPIYGPTEQIAYPGTQLTYLVQLTNEGQKTDAITLSASDDEGWQIAVVPTPVTLGLGDSENIFVYVTTEGQDITNSIAITATSEDGRSEDSCKLEAESKISDWSLFAIRLRFSNEGEHREHLTFYVSSHAKISNSYTSLEPGSYGYTTVVFDPTLTQDLYLTSINVEHVRTGNVASIGVEFRQNEIIATGFDMQENSYNFSNNILPGEGYCYGMAVTSALYFKGQLALPHNKESTYDLTMMEEAFQKIDEYQFHYKNFSRLYNQKNAEAYEMLVREIKNNNPMLIALGGHEEGKDDHCVVAYKIAKGSDRSYILVYDPNWEYSSGLLNMPLSFRYVVYDLEHDRFLSYSNYTKFKVEEAKVLTIGGSLASQVLKRVVPAVEDLSKFIKQKIAAVFDCPVNIAIIDEFGRLINDQGINKIPGADVSVVDNSKIFLLPRDLRYSVTLTGYAEGKFTLTLLYGLDEAFLITNFENLAITPNTVGSFEIELGHILSFINMDYDNDGTIDEKPSPDINELLGDVTPPVSSVDPISPYWQEPTPFVITATATDVVDNFIFDELVSSVELFYRYSDDNKNWGPWTSFDVDTEAPYLWLFDLPNGYGYYEFYTVATDVVLNIEAAPDQADAGPIFVEKVTIPLKLISGIILVVALIALVLVVVKR